MQPPTTPLPVANEANAATSAEDAPAGPLRRSVAAPAGPSYGPIKSRPLSGEPLRDRRAAQLSTAGANVRSNEEAHDQPP